LRPGIKRYADSVVSRERMFVWSLRNWIKSYYGADTRTDTYTHIYSVTMKFPNWRYYINTTNSIYRGWTGIVSQKDYLHDVQVSTCFFMHMRITIALMKLVFWSCRRFQDGTNSSD
jgi:hypothetical protein